MPPPSRGGRGFNSNSRLPKKQLPERLREALKRQQALEMGYSPDVQEEEEEGEEFAVERQLMDEVLGSRKGSRPRTSRTQTSDLLGQMASRLRKLEGAMQVLREELDLKERKLWASETENAELRSVLSKDGAAGLSLKLQNRKLKEQITEMEAFLKDYGLEWIGDKNGNEAATNTARESSMTTTTARSEGEEEEAAPEIDTLALLQKLKELAEKARADQPELVKSGNRAQFKSKQAIRVAVYADGILVKAGPFRPFSEKSAQDFARDVFDGYYPREFKKKFPDGVPFQVIDYTHDCYLQSFSGAGQTLGTHRGLTSLANMGDPHLTTGVDDFIEKLPKKVINKNGQVIDIRASLKERLTSTTQTTTPQRAQQDKTISKPVAIRIRKDDDGKQLLLTMQSSQSIGDLRNEINVFRLRRDPYEIRTAFPPRSYEDDSLTLEEAGFVPNATIFLQRLSLRASNTS